MPDLYQGTGGSDIGTLLRLIQEEQNTSALAQPPAAETGSPIRALSQGPLLAPESPGTTRVASLRPEGVAPANPADVQPGAVVPPAAVVAPGAASIVAPGASPIASHSPVAASRPASPSVAASVKSSFPTIGTSLKASLAPSPSPKIAPSPKPAPQAPSKTPSTSKTGSIGAIGGTIGGAAAKKELSALATKLLPIAGKIGGSVVGGFQIANKLLQKATGNSFTNPKKVY